MMLFRGQRLRFKCDGPTKSPMKFVSLAREGTDDERTKEKKRKEEKCLLSARAKSKEKTPTRPPNSLNSGKETWSNDICTRNECENVPRALW